MHTAILRANARAVGLDNTSQFLADYNGTSNDATSDPGSGTSNDTTINETPDSAAANSLLAAEGETAWLQTQLASTVMPSSTDPIVSGYHMFDTAIRVYFVETTAKTLRKLQADTKGVHCVGLGSSMERVRMPFALVPKSLRIPDLKQLLLLPGVVRSSLFGFLQDLLLLGDTLKLDTPKWPVCEFPRAETVSSLCDGIATTCEFTDSLVRQVGVFQMRPAAPLAPADTQEAQPVLVKETKKQIKTDSDNRKWFNDRAAALRKDKRFVEWNRRKFYKEPYVQQYYATYNQNVYNYSIHKQSQVENH